ncbi:Protein MAK-1 a [Aphelenchoides avenae]|nr:Protein MAK-1 a [Aphelenchus avenae]
MEFIEELPTPETASSGVSTTSTTSTKSENPFFAGITYSKARSDIYESDEDPITPTTMQKNLCLNATSDMDVCLTPDGASGATPPCEQQQKLCACATSNPTVSQEAAQPQMKAEQPSFPCKTSPITDEYKITREILGIGESGKVMACFSKQDNTKYALKVLRDGPKSRREVQLHWLTREHENIVTIIDIFENTFDSVKCLLVVCEFLEGGDLLTIFENQDSRPYPEHKVAQIVKQIGSAVQYLHEMNIAHRDIKLENILCSSTDHEKCTYKLGDFGFAKRPERNHLMESPCCTPYYVAPEILGHERYDKSCDMWSLGVGIYILLCGYPPFYSMKGLPISPGMKDRITTGLYAFPPADWDHISDSTKNEIRNLLKTDPASRTTIQQLMRSPFIRLASQMAPSDDNIKYSLDEPAPDSSDSAYDESSSPNTPETPDHVVEPLKTIPAKPMRHINAHAVSARQFPRVQMAKAPRLHSIQEEVGRALDMMRLGGNNCYIKSLKTSGNSLLERRRAAAAIKKPEQAAA